MTDIELRFCTEIEGSVNAIFEIVADMPSYGRWLPNSSAFGGTTNVTPYPVQLGTTYLDAGPIEKPGVVTEFDPPRHISFRHTVQIRQNFLNTDIDAQIRYTLEPKMDEQSWTEGSYSTSISVAFSVWCRQLSCMVFAKKTIGH